MAERIPDSGTVDETSPAEHLRSVFRASQALQAFLEQESWGVTAMARRLGIARSAAHRLMDTLRVGGLLRQDRPGGPYHLGLLLAALGERAARDRPDLAELARPVLQRLVAETGETASLCVVQGDRGLCVASVDSPQSMRFTIGPGEAFPLHAGCIGKVLLAFEPPASLERHLAGLGKQPRFTPNTPAEAALLRAELARIRATDLAFSDSEITPGARSVGAPVRDSSGRVVASLVVSMPAIRLPDAEVPGAQRRVLMAARRLSADLGWTRALPPHPAQEPAHAAE